MPTETKRTPGPLSLEGSEVWIRIGPTWSHYHVASFGDGDDRSRLDAEFYVRACKSFDALVDACRDALNGGIDRKHSWAAVCDGLSAALALAEVGAE